MPKNYFESTNFANFEEVVHLNLTLLLLMAIGVRLCNLIKIDLFCPIVQNYFFSLIMYVWASMFTASLENEP